MIETRNMKPMNQTKAIEKNTGIGVTWKKPNSVKIIKNSDIEYKEDEDH